VLFGSGAQVGAMANAQATDLVETDQSVFPEVIAALHDQDRGDALLPADLQSPVCPGRAGRAAERPLPACGIVAK